MTRNNPIYYFNFLTSNLKWRDFQPPAMQNIRKKAKTYLISTCVYRVCALPKCISCDVFFLTRQKSNCTTLYYHDCDSQYDV